MPYKQVLFDQSGGYRRLLSIGISALLSISTFLTVIPQTEIIVYADNVAEVSTEAELNAAIANSTPQNPQKVRITTPITLTSFLNLNEKGMELVGGELNIADNIYIGCYGYLKLSAGTISGQSNGLIKINMDGRFEMSGGSIIVSSGIRSKGVKVNGGTFAITGGSISNNNDYGDAIYIGRNGTLDYSSGNITGNVSSYYVWGPIFFCNFPC